MKSKIEYIPDSAERINRPVKRRGGILQLLPGQDQFGYGSKITTDTMVRLDNRLYRVYATCYSNAASLWIVKDGKKLHLR